MKYTLSRLALPTLSLALVSVLAGCVSTPAPQTSPSPAVSAPPASLIDPFTNGAISYNKCRSEGRIAELSNGRYTGYCIEND